MGLDKPRRRQIRALDEACSAYEPLCMKLNWDMLETRSENEINDLLCYDGTELVGFLGMYCMGTDFAEVEITGMVHPEFRRQGIFKALFEEAQAICSERGAQRILLVSERLSEAGRRFAEDRGLSYSFSEYRMRCDAYTPPSTLSERFALRPAGPDDLQLIEHINALSFESTISFDYAERLKYLYIADVDGKPVGSIGLDYEGSFGYVFGVAILPEYRGFGYGRAMLGAVLKIYFEKSSAGVILEVATKNDTALSLYQSVGFKTVTVYDYYKKEL
jgi:ribosomal protein S18 acetylase RimI-like enzyme